MNNPARLAFSILASLILVGCGDSNSGGGADGTEAAAADRPRVAYVTNGVADFWTIAKAGANTAGDDFDVSVDVLMPTGGVTDQKRMVEDLITTQVDGIAISPIDPGNQIDVIDAAAAQTAPAHGTRAQHAPSRVRAAARAAARAALAPDRRL